MGRTKRKTGGSLSVDAGDLLFGMIQHVEELIKKFDSLGIKFEKMPSFAKKMADVYVGSFTAITGSIKDLSSKSDKLGSIAAGLGEIAKSTKKFSGTEAQAAAIASLSSAMSQLNGSIAKFPKDTSGITTFTDGIKQLNTAFARLKIPDDNKIRQMNKAADAIRNVANALKSTGTIPPDVAAAFAAATGHGAPGAPTTPPPTGAPPAAPPTAPLPPPPTLREKAMGYAKSAGAAAVGAAVGAGITSLLNAESSAASLSHVMPLGKEGFWSDTEDAPYKRQINRAIGATSSAGSMSSKSAFELMELMARYTANSNPASADMRTMSEAERTAKATSLGVNAMDLNRKIGMDTGSAVDTQLSLERNIGIKAPAFEQLKNTFIALARSGSLTVKDLLSVGEAARDSAQSFQLSGDKAKDFVNKSLLLATAVSNAGIKSSIMSGQDAGFYGDEDAYIADLVAGVTDADYKNNPELVLRKQMAHARSMRNALGGRTAAGSLMFKQMEGVSPRFRGDIKAFDAADANFDRVGPQYAASAANAVDPNIINKELLSTATAASQAASAAGGVVKERLNTPLGGGNDSDRHAAGMASGGIVAPGTSGSGDTVPTRLSPGEEVLTKGDPRHKYNLDTFKRSFAQIEGYYAKGDKPNRPQRNFNPGNIRVDADWKNNPEKAMRVAQLQGAAGFDKDGYLKFANEAAGFAGLERQMRIDAKRGMNVSGFIEKYAPANENNTENYKNFIGKKGFGANVSLADITGTGGSPSLVGSAIAQKALPPPPVQLDPAVMATLAHIADANNGSSETMADAIGLFANLIRSMSSGSRSSSDINSSHDLIASVARGNYAFSRGA